MLWFVWVILYFTIIFWNLQFIVSWIGKGYLIKPLFAPSMYVMRVTIYSLICLNKLTKQFLIFVCFSQWFAHQPNVLWHPELSLERFYDGQTTIWMCLLLTPRLVTPISWSPSEFLMAQSSILRMRLDIYGLSEPVFLKTRYSQSCVHNTKICTWDLILS